MKLDWPDEAELETEANRHRPIAGIELDGQCLRNAVAMVLRVPCERVPPRVSGETVAEWLTGITLEHGVYFEPAKPEHLPPAVGGPWIAIVDTDKPHVTHAVPCVGRTSFDLNYPRAADHAVVGLVPEPYEESA